MAIDLSALTTREALSAIYIGYFDRAADPEGMQFWEGIVANTSFDLVAITSDFAGQSETISEHSFFADPNAASASAFITSLYQNLFNRDPDEDGLVFWSNALTDAVNGVEGAITVGQIITSVIEGAQDVEGGTQDRTTILNKISVAVDWTTSAEAVEDFNFNDAARDSAGTIIDPVDATDSTVEAATSTIDSFFALGGGGNPLPEGSVFRTEVGFDKLTGTDGDDTFIADLQANDLGGVVNTFASGDVLEGGIGTDTLDVTLISETFNSVGGIQPVRANTNSIENVFLQVQAITAQGSSTPTGASLIDAENMTGVRQWWNDGSRSNLQVEDIQSLPANTTFGLRDTDADASSAFYFDANAVAGVADTDSLLTVTIAELDGGVVDDVAELANIEVNSLSFTYEGADFTLATDDISAAETWEELESAFTAALAAEGALAGLTLTHAGNGVFTFEDPDNGVFAATPNALDASFVNIDVRNRVEVGANTTVDVVQTDLVLDNVGSGGFGGGVNIGAMAGNAGIDQINAVVQSDSIVSTIRSVNLNDIGTEEFLNTLNITGDGDLTIGQNTRLSNNESSFVDDRVAQIALPGTSGADMNFNFFTGGGAENFLSGIVDVQTLDASGLNGSLTAAASITEGVFNTILDDATDVETFTYTLTDNDDNFTLYVDDAASTIGNGAGNNLDDVSGDALFALEVNLGAGDDRLNLSAANNGLGAGGANGGGSQFGAGGLTTKSSTTIDGGEGTDILELVTSVTGQTTVPGGTSAFAGFSNIEQVVIGGTGNNRFDFVNGNMPGVESVKIGTAGNASTTLEQLNEDDQVLVSGEAQSIVDGNNDGNQTFNLISLNGFQDVDGQSGVDVDLENTARTSGDLFINRLAVADDAANPDGGTVENEISGLNISSDLAEGLTSRTQENFIDDVVGADVTNITLDGEVDLSIALGALAGGTGATAPMTVSGAALTGDLTLAVNVATTTMNNGTRDIFTGTAGENDVLELYGNVDATGPDGEEPTVTGFETVRLGNTFLSDIDGNTAADQYGTRDFSGALDFSAISGVDNILIEAVAPAGARLEDLTGDEMIMVNTDTILAGGQSVQGNLTFTSSASTATLDLTFDALTNDDALADTAMVYNEVRVGNYDAVNLNLDTVAANQAYTIDLNFLDSDEEGDAVGPVPASGTPAATGAYDVGTIDTETVTITGGNDANDTATITGITNAIDLVDFSGYAGSVSNLVVSQFASAASDNNITVATNTNGMTISFVDLTAGADEEVTIETIRFAGENATSDGDLTTTADQWIIQGFDVFDNTVPNTDPQGRDGVSKLDLTALGITQRGDLDIRNEADLAMDLNGDGDMTDYTVTANGTELFEIVLEDVAVVGETLADENFIF